MTATTAKTPTRLQQLPHDEIDLIESARRNLLDRIQMVLMAMTTTTVPMAIVPTMATIPTMAATAMTATSATAQ